MNIKSVVRRIVYGNFYFKTLFWLVNNYLMRISQVNGKLESSSGSTHSEKSIEESVVYVGTVLREYKQYGHIDNFSGKVLELGPGDNAGVALLMQSEGAETVDLVDRFYSARDLEQQSAIYNKLAESYDLTSGNGTWNEAELPGITWHTNESAEDYLKHYEQKQLASQGYYDFIVSRAVLEHVIDPLYIIRQGLKILKQGGSMIHLIDFRDHHYYSAEHEELTFLRVKENLYPHLVSHCGGPNRILLHEYKNLLSDLENEYSITSNIYVTSLAGESEPLEPYQKFSDIAEDRVSKAVSRVNEQRIKFASKFDSVSSEDLAVTGICLVIEKNKPAP